MDLALLGINRDRVRVGVRARARARVRVRVRVKVRVRRVVAGRVPAAELAANRDALGDGGDARVVEREPLRPADGAHVRLKDTWG